MNLIYCLIFNFVRRNNKCQSMHGQSGSLQFLSSSAFCHKSFIYIAKLFCRVKPKIFNLSWIWHSLFLVKLNQFFPYKTLRNSTKSEICRVQYFLMKVLLIRQILIFVVFNFYICGINLKKNLVQFKFFRSVNFLSS